MAFDCDARVATEAWIEREAKLFEAGEYPDKGVTVGCEDLKALETNFTRPVPVLIEHAESPLQLGTLSSVRADGDHLFGVVRLTPEADRLVRQSGAQSLSLGLSSDLKQIVEVSLVRHPRVPSARLFAGHRFTMPWRQPDPEIRKKLEGFIQEGRLTPAQVPLAEALMACPDVIEFEGEKESVRALLIAMLERQPPHALFSELAPASPEAEDALLLPEEEAFYRRYFPGVKLADIARRK